MQDNILLRQATEYRSHENGKQKLQKQRTMSMTEIETQYTRYKYNTFQTNHQKQAWQKDMYENAYIQTIAMEFSRRRKQ